MAWQNEMTLIVRHLVNDLNSSSYTFQDDRIQEAILVSAQLMVNELDFEKEYTIEVDGASLSPDPTEGTKDDPFISLVALKCACILTGSELKTKSLSAMSIKDGPSAIDTRGIVQGLNIIYTDLCSKYETAKLQYLATRTVNGTAILSPYSSPNYSYPRSAGGTHRSGDFI